MAIINGTAGNDTLSGTSGNDTINGSGGNDVFLAGGASNGGADLIDGGAGTDSIEFRERATSGIVVNFAAGTISGGGSGTINFTSIERVVAGNFNDSLSGNAAAQTLTGQGGADTLWGAGGVDTLWGGSGADTFVFRETGTTNADRISDWASGTDKILLDAAVMSALGANGNFAAGDVRFWSSSSGVAHDADDRIIFNTTTLQVFYDADGNGAGAQQLIATLQTGAVLVATDIAVENGTTGGGGSSGGINGTAGNDSLTGTDGDDTLNGLGGNDTLNGLAGRDRLNGGDGDDTLRDYHNVDLGADDTLDGGLGNDVYDLRSNPFAPHDPVFIDAGGVDTIWSNHDRVLPDGFENLTLFEGAIGTGNALNNVVTTRTNEPHFYLVDGADGNDTLLGGDDPDIFQFAAGSGNYGNDSVNGGHEFDTLSFAGTRSAVTADMRAGTATGGGTSGSGSVTFTNVERIVGSDFGDRLTGHDGLTYTAMSGDLVFTGAMLDGAGGNDTLIGGAAGDRLTGGIGNDNLQGRTGNDTLDGGGGSDRYLFAEAPGAANADSISVFETGSDTIVLDGTAHAGIGASGRFAGGDARFFAGASAHDADDRVIYNSATGQLWYDADGNGSGAAQLIATELGGRPLAATDIEVVDGSSGGTGGGGTSGQLITGTSANDTLTGGPGNDTMNGLGGNDLFVAGANGGNDTIDGGTGTDSIEFRERATSAVIVDFSTGSITGGGSGTITFTGIERVVASNFNDTLNGTVGTQTLTGQSGADSLWGAAGTDTLWGGGGADAFIFREMGTANADRVSDFATGLDKVQLDDSAFSSIGAAGNFASGDGRFWSAPRATTGHDANDRVIYNQTTGNLYYDADGSGAGAAQLIATLQSGAMLAAADITVI